MNVSRPLLPTACNVSPRSRASRQPRVRRSVEPSAVPERCCRRRLRRVALLGGFPFVGGAFGAIPTYSSVQSPLRTEAPLGTAAGGSSKYHAYTPGLRGGRSPTEKRSVRAIRRVGARSTWVASESC